MLLEELPTMTDPSLLEIQSHPVPAPADHPEHAHKKWFIFRTSRVPGRWKETVSLRLLRVTDNNETPILLFGSPVIYLSSTAWQRFTAASKTTDLRGISDEQIAGVVEEFLARPLKSIGTRECLIEISDDVEEPVNVWLIELGMTVTDLRKDAKPA